MADTVQTNGRASLLAAVNNRASTRSTRKKKTTMLSPKKFCDFVSLQCLILIKVSACFLLYRKLIDQV